MEAKRVRKAMISRGKHRVGKDMDESVDVFDIFRVLGDSVDSGIRTFDDGERCDEGS